MPKRVKQRSTDINESAFALVQRSTQEPEEAANEQPKKKRKKKPPSAISEYMSKIGSKGGRIGAQRRAENLTPDERSLIAHKAAQARWKKKQPPD